MMDKISDVTRQDIIDVIRNGFVVSFDEPQYDSISGNYIVSYRAKISYHGQLDELGFLERLYDLDNMPSNDSRYSNAHGDISCHLRFGDYEDEYWIFQDERFSLRQGDGDEALLHFLCMMLHPSVRIENSQWRDYLQKFNELLREDGYELYPAKKISGRDIYAHCSSICETTGQQVQAVPMPIMTRCSPRISPSSSRSTAIPRWCMS